jgi:hypothetical protein
MLDSTVARGDGPQEVKEVTVQGPDELLFRIRMEGPYTADVPLQVVCYFPHTAESMTKMKGAPIELDKRLGGVIDKLRSEKRFSGKAIETQLIQSPSKTIPAAEVLFGGARARK